jgi:hypothetical protein
MLDHQEISRTTPQGGLLIQRSESGFEEREVHNSSLFFPHAMLHPRATLTPTLLILSSAVSWLPSACRDELVGRSEDGGLGQLGKQLKRVSQGSEKPNVKTLEFLANFHDVPFGQHVFGCSNLIVLTVLLCQDIPMTFARRCSMRWVMLPEVV